MSKLLEKKKKFYPKVFLSIAILLITFSIIFVRGRQNYAITAIYEEVSFEDCVESTSGYGMDDNEYVPNNEDPQVLVEFDSKNDGIYAFYIEFEEAIDLSEIQIYFGRDGANFNEEDTKIFAEGNSDRVEIVSLKPFEYARIDIDCEFEIKGFGVADELEKEALLSYKWYVMAIVLSLTGAFLLAFIPVINTSLIKTKKALVDVVKAIYKDRKKAIKYLAVTVILFFVAYFLERIYGSLKGQDYFNRYRFLVIYAVMLIPTITWWFRNSIVKKAHIYFFIVVMLVGTINVYAAPRACGISWDDIIHYGKTAYLSWGCDDKISLEDYNNIATFSGSAMAKSSYNILERAKWENIFADNREYVLVETDNYKLANHYVAYVPGAIGLILGRGIGLDYVETFMLGKWVNLLCYAIILSISIKLFRNRGKIIVMAIGLIPTSIFIATAYSYDWWVISLSILAYALFFRELQKGVKISTKKMVLVLAILIIAMLPKAVYFPLIFPLMLFAKDKYQKPNTCRWLTVISMVILVLSFVLPIVTGTGNLGDSRGGGSVDSAGQISFILGQPLAYTEILLRFLKDYLSPDNAKSYLTFMAYYGQAEYYTVCMLMLAVASVIDNGYDNYNKPINKRENIIYKTGVALGIAGSIVLVATALYVSFTPVGHYTINGCQRRYILPVLFIGLFSFCKMRIITSEETKNKITMLIGIVMSYVFLYGIYDLCISYF